MKVPYVYNVKDGQELGEKIRKCNIILIWNVISEKLKSNLKSLKE